VFVTNSLFGIWPVASIDDQRFAIGPMTKRFMTHFDTDHA
jgi:branched-subunit amino acid aminotransferase/4-amino-4-deoxychorismate lyase